MRYTRYEKDITIPLLIYLEDRRISGTFGYLIDTFLKYVNSKTKKTLKNDNTYREHFELRTGTDFILFSAGYPFSHAKRFLLLPIIDEVEVHKYLTKAFSSNFWILLIFFILYMALNLRISVHKDSFDCIFESLTFWSSYKGLRSSILRKMIIYLQIFVFGFIISNLYNSKLPAICHQQIVEEL